QAQADEEIRRILSEGYAIATKAITDNRDALERIATALLEFETLNRDEVDLVIDGMTNPELAGRREANAHLGTTAAAESAKVEKAAAPDKDEEKTEGAGIVAELPEPLGSTRNRLDED
ncbi:MAG: cell division protease FtsH, partial [Myxococcota bacterium]